MSKWWLLGLILLITTACKNVDFAPIYENKETEETKAERAVGPFYEHIRLGNGHERMAVRPLWSYEKIGKRKAMDFIWPLAMSRSDGHYYRSNFLLFFYHDMDLKDPESEHLFWLFPLWFQGVDREKEDYYGFFPIWGEVKDFIGYDSLKWKLFPLSLSSRKGSVESQSYLWPIYNESHSPKEEKFRIFPFYGEQEEYGSHESKFILWPFWHDGHSLNDEKPGEWFLFFPFYGEYKYDGVEKTTLLWPFFSWSKSDKEQAKNTPWPFYTTREAKDGTEEKFSAWPFYTSLKAPGKVYKQYLWPIGTYSYIGDEKTFEERNWWLPFYWSSKIVKEEKVLEDYERYWPFVSIAKHGTKESIRVLSLWPQRRMPSIERNWEAIWEPYRYYKDEHQTSHDILWGLSKYKSNTAKDSVSYSLFPFYERSREKNDYSWAVLKGLFGRHDVSEKEAEYQLLWFINFKVDR